MEKKEYLHNTDLQNPLSKGTKPKSHWQDFSHSIPCVKPAKRGRDYKSDLKVLKALLKKQDSSDVTSNYTEGSKHLSYMLQKLRN